MHCLKDCLKKKKEETGNKLNFIFIIKTCIVKINKFKKLKQLEKDMVIRICMSLSLDSVARISGKPF